MSRKRTRQPAAAASRQPAAAASSQPVAASSVLVARAQYDAAGQGRRMRGWRAPSSGPNRAAVGLETIRNRARDATRNEWSGASGERVWGTNLVGTGIIARPSVRDPKLKALFTEIWDAFCATADADGVLDFYGQQTLAVESWRTSGEVFIRFRPRRVDDGLRIPLQVQLLESDMVPMLDADVWPGLPAGHTIRSGIERDRIGRRTAYWCYREHPGDSTVGGPRASELTRVPASEMRHLYKPSRPGALRGVPSSAPVLPKMRSVGNFDDAVLLRQELANLYTGFRTRPAETNAPEIDPITGKPFERDAGGAPILGLEPGLMQDLDPGEDVKFSTPPDAGANYPDYMRQQHLGIAAGSGTPYELLTGDVRDVSDRTLRIVINEFRRTCEQYQWQLIIPMFCRPAREACARAAVLAGELTPAQAVEFVKCTWHPHAWPYIHPTQDVQARKAEIDAGIKSRAAVVAERGDDIEQTDAERAEDAKREIDLGLRAAPLDPTADPVKKAETAKANAEADQARAQVRAIEAKAADATRESEAAADRHSAEAERARADAALLTAKSVQVRSEAALLEARTASEVAENAARAAALQVARANEQAESESRIAALNEQAAAARIEAQARADALAGAEAFAAEQRALVLAAERRRVEVAELEVAAAKLGLAELEAQS